MRNGYLGGVTERTGSNGSEPRRRGRRWESVLRTVGAMGMAVFFGTLVLNGEVDRSPAWVIWPAFTVMQIGVIGSLVIHLYRRRMQRGAMDDSDAVT